MDAKNKEIFQNRLKRLEETGAFQHPGQPGAAKAEKKERSILGHSVLTMVVVMLSYGAVLAAACFLVPASEAEYRFDLWLGGVFVAAVFLGHTLAKLMRLDAVWPTAHVVIAAILAEEAVDRAIYTFQEPAKLVVTESYVQIVALLTETGDRATVVSLLSSL